MKKLSLTLLFLLALLNSIQAQEIVSQVEPIQTASPKIMVIPYTSEGQDIRTVLENM